jgi:hypothetical protein
VLRGYLRSETVAPLPFRRLAAAHPDTVDAVFRKVLRKPNFTWADHGEALMRRRKPWYYEHEPRPGISVLGARLSDLVPPVDNGRSWTFAVPNGDARARR